MTLKKPGIISCGMAGLLADNSFDKITVRDIVQKAGISRSTFYLHFKDKLDLLEQLTEQITMPHLPHMALWVA
ncbi:helix-turn-helix domain-containing protein [Paenibacillus sp. M1]|uniref:Helix-turn-helix domain-containing protein n=1 Tax=Paenibacillus haidiansis TaxID=1574488 RepID=A0ABU7VPG2_9BACL